MTTITALLGFFKSSFVLGVVTGVIANLVFNGFYNLWKYLGQRSSKYTGWWEQEIFPAEDPETGEPYTDKLYSRPPIKIDYYKLKHTKHKYPGKLTINMEGSIRRKTPEGDRRSWDVCGYLADNELTLLYRAHEGQKSRGAIYVKMSHDGKYYGYYLEEHDDKKHNKDQIDRTPLTLQKINDRNKINELKFWEKQEIRREINEKSLSKIGKF